MKPFVLPAILLAVASQPKSRDAPPADLCEGAIDSAGAQELGADDHGMRPNVMALPKKSSNSGLSKEESARLQAEHLKNITRLAEEVTL